MNEKLVQAISRSDKKRRTNKGEVVGVGQQLVFHAQDSLPLKKGNAEKFITHTDSSVDIEETRIEG